MTPGQMILLYLFRQLDQLLNSNASGSPVICSNFNIHETSWLWSFHTSTAGAAALWLHQLIDFPTCQDAILDLRTSIWTYWFNYPTWSCDYFPPTSQLSYHRPVMYFIGHMLHGNISHVIPVPLNGTFKVLLMILLLILLIPFIQLLQSLFHPVPLKPCNPRHGGIILVKQCGSVRLLIGNKVILLGEDFF